jgi:YVTN family beta-propeller protein
MVPSCARISRYLLIAALTAAALPAVAGAAGPRWAYVSNLSGASLTPIDVFTGTVGTPIATPFPRGSAITPDGTTAYVVNQSGDTVTPVDLQTGTPGTPIPVGSQPISLAITPDGSTAYVTNFTSDNVTPIDLATDTPGAPIAVGDSPAAVAVTPDGATAYVANNAADTVTPIDTVTGTAGTPIPAGDSPFSIGITPDGATAYVVNLGSDDVTPIATATNTAGSPIAVGNLPRLVAITPDGSTAYVANSSSGDVTPIDTATNTAGTAIPAGIGPAAVAITPDGATAYVTNASSNNVTTIDTATNTATGTIAVGAAPWEVVITPNQAPQADFSSTPGAAGSVTGFDAAGSTDPDGTVASFRWDFGDGHTETTTSAAVQHTYADPGTYTATLAVTDDEGCSDEFVYTGRTASCNGSPSARLSHQVVVPAASKPAADPAPAGPAPADPAPAPAAEPAQAIESFSLASRCVRPSRAGMVRVRLDLGLVRRGPVRVQVQRAVGSGAMESCPAPKRGRRFAGRLRGVEMRQSIEPRVAAAAVSGRMTLRMRLRPGLYRIAVRAYGAEGGELTRPAHRWLRVLG